VHEYQTWRSVGNKEGGIGDFSKQHGVKRQSTLCDLPYWHRSTIGTIFFKIGSNNKQIVDSLILKIIGHELFELMHIVCCFGFQSLL
jgi:hypothetical protein